jgi:hypothetical protein
VRLAAENQYAAAREEWGAARESLERAVAAFDEQGSPGWAVHTVELHLSHAYAKLGIRSRTQLAGRLTASGQRPKD